MRAMPVLPDTLLIVPGGQGFGHGGQLRGQRRLGQKMDQSRSLRQARGPAGEKGFVLMGESRVCPGGQFLIRRHFPAQGRHGFRRVAPGRRQQVTKLTPERPGQVGIIRKVSGCEQGRALRVRLRRGGAKAARIRTAQTLESRPLQTQSSPHDIQQCPGQPGQSGKAFQTAGKGGVGKGKKRAHICFHGRSAPS